LAVAKLCRDVFHLNFYRSFADPAFDAVKDALDITLHDMPEHHLLSNSEAAKWCRPNAGERLFQEDHAAASGCSSLAIAAVTAIS